MTTELLITAIPLFGLLGIAVVFDLLRHRIPNLLILLGLALGFVSQAYVAGWSGLGNAFQGMAVGFAVFLPLYALGGMAAGDVKLMAMAGAFLSHWDALWAAAFSLIAGGVCGFLIVLFRGQLPLTLARYGLMFKARAYLAPASHEVAGKPFPYSVAVLLGTLGGVYWMNFS